MTESLCRKHTLSDSVIPCGPCAASLKITQHLARSDQLGVTKFYTPGKRIIPFSSELQRMGLSKHRKNIRLTYKILAQKISYKKDKFVGLP